MKASAFSPSYPSLCDVLLASATREWLGHRLNRFLHAHLALVAVAGLLPLLTPGEALVRGATWWLMHAVLYAVSLSALLLGLSSAHAEADEREWILVQPAGVGPWLAGKAAMLVALVTAAAGLLVLPTWLAGGGSTGLALMAGSAAAVSAVFVLLGLAVGCWVKDGVTGLIAAVAAWFALLYGTDLLLLGFAGAPWVQANPDVFVGVLMANPLDAFRVGVLFAVERAAFSGLAAGPLAGWWHAHPALWLALLCATWTLALGAIAWRGARRPLA